MRARSANDTDGRRANGRRDDTASNWSSSISYVFGSWFLACLLLAFRAIRRDDVVNHRRWMIRAFAMGVGVGTIRIWLGLFEATGLFGFQDGLDVAFWLAFPIHAAVAELWIRTTPHPGG